MKIVAIADIHCQFDKITIPPCDLLINAGDLTWEGTLQQIAQFNYWAGTLQHVKHFVTIAGNHDFLFQDQPSLARSLITNCDYIEDQTIIVNGIKIYGAPWTPRFHDWAFNADRGEVIKKHWDKIPEGIDILLTHGPAYGYGDKVIRGSGERWEDGEDFAIGVEYLGCKDLYDALVRVKPKYHIFGHIHQGFGIWRNDFTTFINASVCTKEYNPINPPIMFEI